MTPREKQVARQSAYTAVARAIRHGRLPRIADCACMDCGGQAEHYDHRDYGKPLQVEPTCRVCNYKRGPGAPADITRMGAE